MENNTPDPAELAINAWKDALYEKYVLSGHYSESWFNRYVKSAVSVRDLPSDYTLTDVKLYDEFGEAVFDSPDDFNFYPKNP